VLNANRPFPHDPANPGSPLIPDSVTHMAMRLRFKDKDGKDVSLDTRITRPSVRFQASGGASVAAIPFGDHIRDPIIAALTRPAGGLKESQFSAEVPITVETYILVEGNTTPIRLDDDFTLTVKVRDAVTATVAPFSALDLEERLPDPLP
jgi:hypothetical protein